MVSAIEQRRHARREELVKAALRALARRGPGVSMEAIAAEAGVTKPILYRHFGDQAGLAGALAQRYLAELTAELAPHAQQDLRAQTAAQLDAGLRVIERHPGLYEYITQERGFERAAAEQGGPLNAPFVDFLAAVLERAGLDVEAAGPWATGMAGMFYSSTLWWIRTGEMPREQFVDYIVRLLWDGLGSLLGPAVNPRVGGEPD
jgi:AcrR family transcriptional regulator